MAKLGLKTFSMAVDKAWDHIPDSAFNTDTYVNQFKKGKDKAKGNEKDRDRDRRRRRRSTTSDPADRDDDDYRSHRRSQSQQHQRQQQPYTEVPYDHSREDQNYQDQRRSSQQEQPAHQQQRISAQLAYYAPVAVGYQPPFQQQPYIQGDPNFPYNVSQNQHPQSQDRGSPQDGSLDRYLPSDSNPIQSQESLSMQNDQYYPPPPARDPSGYHRYNPADYTPQGSSGNGHQDDRYATARYDNREPYQRPASAGYEGNARYGSDSYGSTIQDDRKGRDKHKSSHKDRSRSGSGSGVRGMMHKNLDTSERGLAAGGIGALAGGYIGHRIGKGPLATVAGVLLGGIGANVWEGREERLKEEKRGGERHSRRRAKSEGRGRDRGASGYDDEDGNRFYNEQPLAGREREVNRGYYDDDEEEYQSDGSYDRGDRRSHSRKRDRDYKRPSR